MAASILICDDDELVLDLIEYRLISRGYEIIRAKDGEELLQAASSRKPQLIILDAIMPKLDGFEALKRLKAIPEVADIPVVMLTARKGERDIVSALENGAEDYLVKPFIPDELITRVQKILAKR